MQAELGGRHYAGGVLELVPSEIRSLKLPLLRVNKRDFNTLEKMVRLKMDISEILDYTDDLLLKRNLGLRKKEIRILRECYLRVRSRRLRER